MAERRASDDASRARDAKRRLRAVGRGTLIGAALALLAGAVTFSAMRERSAARVPASVSAESNAPALPERAAQPRLVASTLGADPRALRIPVEGIAPEALSRQFLDRRGSRFHHAIDILAPRHTPVLAADDGTIAKLYESELGGITIYQFDPERRFTYYYAHLQRYAPGLAEGDAVRKGQVIGFVGTSGNAPRDTPHLHFAIFRMSPAQRWWEGEPVDPFDYLATPRCAPRYGDCALRVADTG